MYRLTLQNNMERWEISVQCWASWSSCTKFGTNVCVCDWRVCRCTQSGRIIIC